MSSGIEEDKQTDASMEVKRKREGQDDDEEGRVREIPSKNPETDKGRQGKSCKGTLYFSSHLKSKGRNPRCVGFTRSLQQGLPSYIVSESEVEASKEGRSLTEFKYACVGYSIYLNNKNEAAPLNGEQKPRAELPVCVGVELLVDKRPVDHNAPAPIPASAPSHAQNKEGEILFSMWKFVSLSFDSHWVLLYDIQMINCLQSSINYSPKMIVELVVSCYAN
uniref:DUF8204 domain-containing protein n=1 Tax=Chenopodium quinoa TaxID=63459 RepID=A0A803L709_CHEQI